MLSKPLILPSHKTPISFIMDIVTAYILNPSISYEKLKEYADKGDSYTRSGIITAKLLGLLAENDQGVQVHSFCIDNLGKIPNEETKTYVFRKLLQEWEPFIMFIQLCNNGESISSSARKIYALFPFQNKDNKFLEDLLISWGKSTGIFNYSKKVGLTLNKFIIENKIRISENELNLDEDVSLRLIILDSVGEEAFHFLDRDEIQELVDAFRKYENDPRGAIECAARAFEDFLRRVSLQVDLSKANGIGQLVNKLYNNKDSNGDLKNIIHSKHLNIGSAIGDVRNMAGHSKESKTLERWDLSVVASKTYIFNVLLAIRSIYIYTNNGRFVY